MATISYQRLRQAVDRDGVALRLVVSLQPAGGQHTPVFPPTYGVDGGRIKYAVEGPRPRDGQQPRDVRRYARVLLDSVASQANRMEEALEGAWERGELSFPVAYVDFSDDQDVADLDRITVLEAPHRIADAIFRDSLLEGQLFRTHQIGAAVTEARPDHATGLYRHCPTALLFGQWDSTGPKGGLGAKFQRALVSEIVGHDVELGVKVGSRIDPLQIEIGAATIYAARDQRQEWTLLEGEADQKNGKAVLFDRRGGSGEKGQPSKINHGNVKPSIDEQAGGAVIDHATQTLVISLAALRKLRFPLDAEGAVIDRDQRRAAETAARTAIAALGVAAASYQIESDYDLRSRCLLVPQEAPQLELLGRAGNHPETFDLDTEHAADLVHEASRRARDLGLGWNEQEIRLAPAPKLVELIRRSRHIVITEGGELPATTEA